eukprot:SAG11_NODE_529_length_8721_cov_24.489330_3_plen_130_part_00
MVDIKYIRCMIGERPRATISSFTYTLTTGFSIEARALTDIFTQSVSGLIINLQEEWEKAELKKKGESKIVRSTSRCNRHPTEKSRWEVTSGSYYILVCTRYLEVVHTQCSIEVEIRIVYIAILLYILRY